MLNESNAALIPFDRIFKLSADSLKENYRVNLFELVKKENSELLGLGLEDELEEVNHEESEEEEEQEEEEDEGEQEDSNQSEEETEKKPANAKKKSKERTSKKVKELDYDFDDPFIDDSEITDIYQSVFELMRGGCGGGSGEGDSKEINDEEEDEEDNATSKVKGQKRSRTKVQNYFVYRGAMSPEILSKEFELELIEGDPSIMSNGSGLALNNEDFIDGDVQRASRKEKNKKSTSTSNTKKKKKNETGESSGGGSKRKSNPESQQATAKKIKVTTSSSSSSKPAKPAKPAKPTDLIAQSAKKFNDIFSTDSGSAVVKPVIVFNVTGIDAGLLELREVIKRFRDGAVGTSFSPGKFPSALRPRLNETICTVLRAVRPTLSNPLPSKFFSALAAFLPFSPGALMKLLSKKILNPLIDSLDQSEVPKLYAQWTEIVAARLKESGGIVQVATSSSTGLNKTTTATEEDTLSTLPVNASESAPTSPLKLRLKFNDEMRLQAFEIVRAETDLNNLQCLRNLLDASAAPKIVQSELVLRKNIYQKLVNLSQVGDSVANDEQQAIQPQQLLSTTEISKEFAAQRRKHEKRISKLASEILFGEAEIEEFLRELAVEASSSKTVPTTASAPTTIDDPLNLFKEDSSNNPADLASNASLVMESNEMASSEQME